MDFRFYPLRFDFIARQNLFFPPGQASNILRGALGIVFRSLVCRPECGGAATCESRDSCLYARAFEPVSGRAGPSGLADSPRPFVFRARHLDGLSLQPGQPFHFDLNLFSLEPETLACFVLAFAELARRGLGPSRGTAELQTVRRLLPEEVLYTAAKRMTAGPVEPVTLCLDPQRAPAQRIRVEFLSPVELKHDGQIAARPEFAVLFGRARDRICTLSSLYGNGPLAVDYEASGDRAALVGMTRCEMTRTEARRRSSRTGQVHPLGGFTGFAEYEGALAEFLPWLEAARFTGVGRQAVWGKGEIRVEELPAHPGR